MLHSTRRLLTEDLHPLERSAALEIVSLRGGRADAEALLPVLLADPENNGGLIDPVARHGDAAMVQQLYDRFVDGDRLVEGADPRLLWAFGWAGLEHARLMLFHYACQQDWDTAPAAVDGLVHLSPAGLEAEVRAAVETCVGKNLFAEYLPALAGWIGDADLLDRFLPPGYPLPSPDCMAGVILGVGLLGAEGRSRLHDLFWTSDWPWIWGDQPYATGLAMRMTGLGVADLARELRARLEAPGEPEHWWFSVVNWMAKEQVAGHGAPPVWRFLPPSEAPLELHRALFGPNDGWDENLGHIARDRLPADGERLSGDCDRLRGPIEDLIRRDALIAEFTAP
jgi:hypothetical protein